MGIVSFSDIGADDIATVGGKGLSLAKLIQFGLPVPNGFVITTQIYRQFAKIGLSDDLQREILAQFDVLGAERVAVRSSAIAEDSSNASWAGQFESYLNVDRAGLIEAVQKCWQSADSEKVHSYADRNGVASDQLAIAVVVQAMVNSEISGVAFSLNPITNSRDEIMIETIYGLGELLVQGMVTPDNYLVSKDGFNVVSKTTGDQSVKLVYSNGQNVQQQIESDGSNCLNDDQIKTLCDLIMKIEQYYGSPQDIEWAFEKGQFYIIQSRPITTI